MNICSGSVFGLPGSAAYSSAKGAILGLTKALASERHTSGITVNGVMPMARTRMYEAAGGVAGSDEDQLMTRHFPAEAVAPVVAYLGWEDVPWNGEIFEVAGRAVSRIVFASGPTIDVREPEDVAANIDTLQASDLHAIGSLDPRRSALVDYSTIMAEHITAAGGDVTIEMWPEAFHAWHMAGDGIPESRDAFDQVLAFIDEHWRRP